MCGMTARHTLLRRQNRAEAVETAQHRAHSTTQHNQITAPRQKKLTFRHRASCILGQAFRYSPENAFYIFNQQIYFII